MAPSLATPRLPSQPRPGVGARLLRRIGDAVRNVIAGSLTLAGASRPTGAPQPGFDHAVVGNAEARPAPGRAPRVHRSRTAPPELPSQPAPGGWFARFLCRHYRAVPVNREQFSEDNCAPFTLEEFPGLLPEACAFFNTPLEDLDPEILPPLLRAFAEKVVDLLPPEAGMTDAQELYSTLWGGFAAVLDHARPDDSQGEALDPSPAIASQAVPDASVVARNQQTEASAPALTEASPDVPFVLPNLSAEALPDLPRVPPAHLPEVPATDLQDAAILAAASETTPHTASLSRPVLLDCSSVFRRGQLILYHNERTHRRGRRLFRCCRVLFFCGELQTLLLRHWYYAARAGPA